MKVKLTTSRVGHLVAYSAGDEVEVSGEEAKRLIEAGKAVPSRGESRAETADAFGKKKKARKKRSKNL